MAVSSSLNITSSLRFRIESSGTNNTCIVLSANRYRASPKLFVSTFPSLHSRASSDQFIVASIASREKTKHLEVEIEKVNEHAESEVKESQETWKEALASMKEQALKMHSVTQEAYELYSNKAIVILKQNAEHLKIQADKTRHDLTVLMKEVNEEGQEYFSNAAKQSPEPVKEIVETFASSKDELKDISKIRDFCIGIPYGAILSLSGFLSFMITGSIPAIRFGVILGGTILALSISSMKSQKRGEPYSRALNGQAAISSIIFLREVRLLTQGIYIGRLLTTFIRFPRYLVVGRRFVVSFLLGLFYTCGAMVAFYVYKITSNGMPKKGMNMEHGAES